MNKLIIKYKIVYHIVLIKLLLHHNVLNVLKIMFYQQIKNNVLKKLKIVKYINFNVVLIFYLLVIKIVINVKYIVKNVTIIIIMILILNYVYMDK